MTTSGSSLSPNEQVVALAITDEQFRQALVDDPEAALSERNIRVSAEDMQRLTSMSREERQQAAEALDTRQSAARYMDNKGY
jgi:hypothetical protein